MKLRYIPFTQQPYCCTPTCIQMIMYKNGIALRSQEEIGYEIGLTVPEDEVYLFSKVRTGEKPPAGWGTQISNPKYNLNDALDRLNVPLKMEQTFISKIKSPQELVDLLSKVEKRMATYCYVSTMLNFGTKTPTLAMFVFSIPSKMTISG